MGVSLRTLTKLTNPAMARWWRKRGMWLLGTGVWCGLTLSLWQWYTSNSIRHVTMHPGMVLLGYIALVVQYLGTSCFLLYALNAAGISITACRNIEEESAAPAGTVPVTSSYAIALLRTWPAFIGSALMGLLPWIMDIPRQLPLASGSDLIQHLLFWVVVYVQFACAIWLGVMWLVALKAVATDIPWLDWVWVCGLQLTLGALLITSKIVTVQLRYSYSQVYFTTLSKNVYLIECAVAGLVLFALAIWLRRHQRHAVAVGLCLLLAGAGLLNNASNRIPLLSRTDWPDAVRFPLSCLAQLAEGLVHLPFFTTDTGQGLDLVLTLRSIYPLLYIKLSPWFSFISLLLNLAWLAALYLLISRVLLREPRRHA